MNLIQVFAAQETATDPSARNLEIIHSPKWVRVSFAGEFIAGSKNVILLRQKGRTPVYYFPQRDVHPRDPYTRIEVIQSHRNVRIELNGEIIAETDRPVLLFETGLTTRYYIPAGDVRSDLLEPSDTHTAVRRESCPLI